MSADAFSPMTKWLASPGRRLSCTVFGGRATVRLLDAVHIRGVMSVEASGATVEEAMANALNALFAQQGVEA